MYVSKYNYYSAPKSELDWLNLPHWPTLPLPVTADCQTSSGQIPGDELEQEQSLSSISSVNNLYIEFDRCVDFISYFV